MQQTREKRMRDNTLRFRTALRRRGLLAYLTGKITREQWKKVQEVVWNPDRVGPDGEKVNLLEEVMEEACCELQAQGKIPITARPEEVDWDSLLDFLKELLPFIIQFIEALMAIFGGL